VKRIRRALASLIIPAFTGCAGEPETPAPQTPASCPIRDVMKLRQELDGSINSMLKLIETYEIMAYLFNRTDLLIMTESARRKIVTMRTRLFEGQSFDRELLDSAVQDLLKFERQLYLGEHSL
jgi:hypothetical protein